jgi:hypothetical protein
VEWDESEAVQIEVFTCCEASRQRVCEVLSDLLAGIAQPVHRDPV